MVKSSKVSPAYNAARRWGRRYGLITVPLTVVGTGRDKKVQPKKRYAHLNGEEFSEELFRELWWELKETRGLGIYSPDLIKVEADSAEGDDALVELGLRSIATPTFRSTRGHKYLFSAPAGDILTNAAANGAPG